jgi:hypothetical protein
LRPCIQVLLHPLTLQTGSSSERCVSVEISNTVLGLPVSTQANKRHI